MAERLIRNVPSSHLGADGDLPNGKLHFLVCLPRQNRRFFSLVFTVGILRAILRRNKKISNRRREKCYLNRYNRHHENKTTEKKRRPFKCRSCAEIASLLAFLLDLLITQLPQIFVRRLAKFGAPSLPMKTASLCQTPSVSYLS